MVQEQKNNENKNRNSGLDLEKMNMPVVIKIKPGTAAEKSMKFVLPKEMYESSIEDVVKYGLRLTEDDGMKRDYLRIQERVTVEMKDKYGLSINGTSTNSADKVRTYLRKDQSAGGVEYLEAEIIVAARQEGARMYKSLDSLL